MNSIIKIASAGTMVVGLIALGLAGATTAQAAGLKPVGQDDHYSMNQGETITIPAPGILANDSDAEGDPLHVGNAFGFAGTSWINVGLDGSFTFTPDPAYYGQVSFAYYPSDGDLGAQTGVYITINPTIPTPPVAPVANGDAYTTAMGTVLTVPAASGVLANDVGPAYIYTVNEQGGEVVVDQDGSFVYTPAPGFVGTKTFTYNSSNGVDQSNFVTVSITVTGAVAPPIPAVPPVANPDAYSTVQDTVLTVPASGLLTNDSFPAGSVIDVDDISGEIVAQLDGSFVYTPAAGFVGLKEFAYRMTDGTTLSGWADVEITVTAAPVVPAAPVVTPPTVIPPAVTPPAAASPAGTSSPSDDELSTLAYTGSPVSPWLLAPGLAFLAIGGLGLWVSGRRARLS